MMMHHMYMRGSRQTGRGGGMQPYAFLCQGSTYSNPRWAKMSFSVVAARNSFWREKDKKKNNHIFGGGGIQLARQRRLEAYLNDL